MIRNLDWLSVELLVLLPVVLFEEKISFEMSLNPEGDLIKKKKRKVFLNSDSSGSDDKLSQQNKVQKRTVRLSQRRLSTPSKWDLALKKLREKRANSKAPKRLSQSGVGFGNSSGSGEDGNNCKVDSVDNRESMSDLQEELLSDNVVRSDLLSDSDVDQTEMHQSTELKGRLLLNGEEIDSVGGWNEFIHNTNESGTLPSNFDSLINYKSGKWIMKTFSQTFFSVLVSRLVWGDFNSYLVVKSVQIVC